MAATNIRSCPGCRSSAIKTDGSPDGIKIIKQGFNVDPMLQKQADCVSTMTYNEYWQVIDGGYKPSQLVVFKYDDEGVATLEDGLYVLEKNLKDPAFVTKMAKFVKASMKGWDYAKTHRRRSREDHPRRRHHRRQDREGPEADDGRNRQAARRPPTASSTSRITTARSRR